MPLPPVHTFTHIPELIHACDQDWDHPRINRELALCDAKAIGMVDRLRAGKCDDKVLETLRLQLGDDAVDVERWVAEIDACPWPTRDDHPVWRYWLIQSRCDLSTVAAYLIEGAQPVTFTLRRAKKAQWKELRRLENRGDEVGRLDFAVAVGLAKITGPGSEVQLELKGLRAGKLTEDDLERLREAFGDDVVDTIGQAVCLCSASLRVDEGKP